MYYAKQYTLVSKATLHKPYTSPTASSWVCLKTNGPIRLHEGFAVIGGFVSDRNSGWMIRFCKYLSKCIVTEVEF